jgi:putative restriction endonuclease
MRPVAIRPFVAALISLPKEHPRRFAITGPAGESFILWIYIWTLTPGGRPQLRNEYRIQITGVQPPFDLNPTGPTVLLGYDPNLKMFAGFDLSRPMTFGGSPSVQIDIRAVNQAQQDGLAFDRKENNEIAIGIRPDQLIGYVRNVEQLHSEGAEARVFGLLEQAAAVPRLSPADSSRLDAELERLASLRREIVQEVRRLAREANFRQQVLHAYGARCAVTRVQLRLVDAAHILPVGAPGSIDHVRNGIALAPTYHRAFDNGLIYLEESFTMRLNSAKLPGLQTENLIQGLESFKEPLGKIYLPQDRSQWPSEKLIRRANDFRRIDVA